MRKKIKKYYVNPDDSAVLAMAVVDEPAIESDFVYLSKQKIDKFVALENNEKHMIFGAALRPDFPIYRRDEEGEYYLEFSKEAVEKLARNFMLNGLQKCFNEQHIYATEGITITESWIKTDMEKDKSVAIGLDKDLPLGTWFIGAYCENDDVWDKVKNGTYNGFSVEAICDVSELKFEAQEPVAEPQVEPVVEPAPVQEPVVETPVPEPKKDNKSILDKILALINGGDVKDVVDTAKEVEKPTEVAPEEPKVEEVKDTPEPEQKPVTEPEKKPETQPNPLEEVVENLKAEIEELKKNNEALINKIGEISKEPSAKPVNTNAGNGGAVVEGINNPAYQNWRDKIRQMS